MKYTVKQYASSLLAVLEGQSAKDRSAAVKNFLRVLARNGDAVKKNQIIEEAEKEYFRKEGISKVVAETAGEAPSSIKKDIEEALHKKVDLVSSVNPGIIGGIKILIDDETLIDASVKTQLNKLFSRV